VYHVLHSDESVVATCYDSNYYTFATTDAAAIRMYEDNDSLRNVKRLMREEGANKDLTLVKGNRLVLLSSEFGIGPGTLRRYREHTGSNSRLNSDAIRDMKKQIAEDTMSDVKLAVDTSWSQLTPLEKQLIENTMLICRRVIMQRVLKVIE
jgi:hypothetical protein